MQKASLEGDSRLVEIVWESRDGGGDCINLCAMGNNNVMRWFLHRSRSVVFGVGGWMSEW